jgi:O-antigen ligase
MFVVHSVTARRWEWLRAPDVQLLFALWVYMMITALLFPAQGTLRYALVWGRFPLFYAAMRLWLITNNKQCTRLALAALFVTVAVTLDSFWQYITGVSFTGQPMRGDRLSGPLTSANVGKLLICLMLPAVGWLLSRAENKRLKWVALIVACAVTALVPLTGERAVTLLMLGGLILAALTLWLLNPYWRRHVLKSAAILAVMAALLSTQEVVRHRGMLLFEHLRHFVDSPYGQLFTAAYDMWEENPVFGVGLLRFHNECLRLLAAHDVVICDVHAHNIYLNWLAETGLIGAGIFITFAAWCAWCWWRFARTASGTAGMAAAGTGAVMFILLFPVTVTQNLFSNWPGALFWFTLAFSIGILSLCKKPA